MWTIFVFGLWLSCLECQMLIRSSPVPVWVNKSLTCRQICRAALETAPSYGPVNTFSVTLTHSCVCVCVLVSSCPKFLGSLNQQQQRQQRLKLAPLMTKTMCWVEAFSATSLGKPAPWTTDKTKLYKSTKISRPGTHTSTTTTWLCKAIPLLLFPLFPPLHGPFFINILPPFFQGSSSHANSKVVRGDIFYMHKL